MVTRATLVLFLCALTTQSTVERASERLKVLRTEADELSTREKSLVGDLRRLELERQIRTEELAAFDMQLAQAQLQVADAQLKIGALAERDSRERPDVAARLVRVYMIGRAGYWRLLLDREDLRAIGRTYRTAAALSRFDGDRARILERTSREMANQQQALEARARDLATLRDAAATARRALDGAVVERASLLKTIGSRRDLALQLVSELAEAQEKLAAFGAASGAQLTAPTLPLRPFAGDLPWPADGIVLSRFGRQPARGGFVVTRNGVEISLAEGQPVAAVHDGVVSFAAPFTGYASLVIVDHGNGAQTVYGHLASIAVFKGGRVSAGTTVGRSGRNPGGNPSLYFELRVDGKPVDPLQWLRKPL